MKACIPVAGLHLLRRGEVFVVVTRPRRRGATLVDVLCSLAIIGVLAALLLPAVQRMREAANRTRCLNQLRQLGLGLHLYHESAGSFPQAYNEYWNLYEPSDQPDPPDSRPKKSWATFILPYLDRQAIAQSSVLSAQTNEVPNFLCPSDPRADKISRGGAYAYLGNRFGLTSYLAVEGSAYENGPDPSDLCLELGGPKDGVIYRSSDIRITDIVDGTSYTLLLGERPPSPAPALDWGWWAWSAYDSALAVVDRRSLVYPSCPSPALYGPGDVANACDANHFWSFHPSGACWLFADGSVRFIPYKAVDLLPALASRNGSEVIDVTDLPD